MPLSTAPADAQHGMTWWSVAMVGGAKGRQLGGTVAAGSSTAWPVANTALLVPFAVAVPVTFQRIFFLAGTTPGTTNYDLGIYTDGFALIKSLGATAAVSTTDAILPVGGGAFPLTLPRGRYYIAMASQSTALTVRGASPANGVSRAYGCVSMASAYPLPATITPAQANAFFPSLGLTTHSTMI